MRSQKAPRYQGRITSWKDDGGFGFITPNGGGPAVFVHIKSFSHRRTRPAGNEIVTYHLTVNEAGKPRAEDVAFVGEHATQQAVPASRARSLLAAIGFLACLGALVCIGKIPPRVFGLYAGLSLMTFVVYGIDKAAARRNRWRTQENTLHLLALLGGWPGALLAQQILRHKSTKQSFRIGLWWTVAANCVALGWILSPSGTRIFGPVLGLP